MAVIATTRNTRSRHMASDFQRGLREAKIHGRLISEYK